MLSTSLRKVARLFSQQPRIRRTRRYFRGCFTVQALEARILLDGEEDPPYDPPPFAADDYFFAGDYNQEAPYQDTVTYGDDSQAGDVFSVVDEPEHGTLDFQPDGSFTYTPDGTYAGIVEFTYQIDDGVNPPSDPATVQLELYNPPPEANDDGPYQSLDNGTLTIDVSYGLLVNDSKDERETNTASVVNQPQHGTVSVSADGSFTYTPEPLYLGLFWFTYKITDTLGAYSTAIAQVNVQKVEIERAGDYQGENIWIGETVSLTAVLENAMPNATYSWEIDGEAVAGYVFDNGYDGNQSGDSEFYTDANNQLQAKAQKIPLTSAMLQSSGVTVHWIEDGTAMATVTVTAGGQTSTAFITYQVSKPEGFTWTDTTSGVQLSTVNNTTAASLGSFFGAPGISLNLANAPAVGDYRYTTIASIFAQRTLASGPDQYIQAAGGDNGYPFSGHFFANSDTPSIGLSSSARSYSASESFETWLMWHGPRPGIYVPLQKMNWNWNFTATSANGINWALTGSGGTLNQTINGQDTTEFPEFETSILTEVGGISGGDYGGWQEQD